jgi:hypothetical protein
VRVDAREAYDFWRRVEIQKIRPDQSKPWSDAVVLMRTRTRPECLFGWRTPTRPGISDQIGPNVGLKGAAEMDATDVWPNVDQDVLAIGYGFPEGCFLSSITWFRETV